MEALVGSLEPSGRERLGYAVAKPPVLSRTSCDHLSGQLTPDLWVRFPCGPSRRAGPTVPLATSERSCPPGLSST